MGRRNQNLDRKKNQREGQEGLLETLGDFTSKDNWDKFFTIRGSGDSFEWYAEWPQLRDPLLSLLHQSPPSSADAASPCASNDASHPQPSSAVPREVDLQILVPGCGNSRLSEQLYDAGFRAITNIDFSKVVISDMLRRNVRERPGMRWRVMDMTSMQFEDGMFDVVLDKGGLDALMEPELGPKLGNQYLSEVKRVLKSGGKFICLTLAESYVLGLLFQKFRFGWKMILHSIPQAPDNKPGLSTYMVVAEKDKSHSLNQITVSFDCMSMGRNGDQAHGLHNAIEIENHIRQKYLDGSGIMVTVEDLQLGAVGDISELKPGRRVQLTLGGEGDSCFRYRAVLLDSQQNEDSFLYHCGVFLVPKERAHEWLFASVEGQWVVVESSKAGRLIMILLDSSHAFASMDEIQNDLSPLVKQLEPHKHITRSQIPFMMAGDGIKHRKLVHQVKSKLTGSIVVEDVIYETVDNHLTQLFPKKELVFRRLVFRRTEGLVQSEALLMDSSPDYVGEAAGKKPNSASKLRKKSKDKIKDPAQPQLNELSSNLEVNHIFLASSYHTGIVAGIAFISSYLQSMILSQQTVKAVVIGLGAGLLPMFLRKFIPLFVVEVVELDPEVLNLARDYFGFSEDKNLKVHLADGVEFVKKIAESAAAEVSVTCIEEEPIIDLGTSANASHVSSEADGKMRRDLDLIIIDVDSSDSSSGLSCPAAGFVENSFLSTVSHALSQKGLFVINLVSRSPSVRSAVVSRMKMVFSQLYSLQLEEDVNEVVFALKSSPCNKDKEEEDDDLSEGAFQLEKMLKLDQPDITRGILDTAKKIRRLK
ncbi:hypothetical protein Dimus_029843 [Dionaea muscipula]